MSFQACQYANLNFKFSFEEFFNRSYFCYLCPGESVPELKTPLQAGDRQYRSDTEHRHTLFSGTKIIQAKCGKSGDDGAVAVVTNTGKESN